MALLAGLLALSGIGHSDAAIAGEPVALAPYRIPDRYLSVANGSGTFGYGYPPAYGFDTANHNVQCYIAPSEDSAPFGCGVQHHRWTVPRHTCGAGPYAGVIAFAGAVYGSERPSASCSDIPIVPRERTPGSTATTGRQVNPVLRPGSSITYLGVTCSATGSGRAATIRCVERRNDHVGFAVSYNSVQTFKD